VTRRVDDLEHLLVAELLEASASVARQMAVVTDETEALAAADGRHAELTRHFVELSLEHARIARELTRRVVRAAERRP
jgi:hypothetical protein